MIVITGITGQVGGVVARHLIAAGKKRYAPWCASGPRIPRPPALKSITLTRPMKWTPLWSKLCHPAPLVDLP